MSIIESLKKADVLFSKVGQLVEVDIKSNAKEEYFPNIFFNNLIEAKITQEFLDEDFF